METELALLRNSPKVEAYIRSMKEPIKEKRRKGQVDGESSMVGRGVQWLQVEFRRMAATTIEEGKELRVWVRVVREGREEKKKKE